MIEAEKAQHLWFAVGFLWTLSIIIAFFLAKVIKPRSINIENKTPKMEIEKREGLEVTTESIRYDFPVQKIDDRSVTRAIYETERAEEHRKAVEDFNRATVREDVKKAAEKLEKILEENTEEALKERVNLTIVTTKDAMKKLEKIKAASGKSFSRIITEKIL